MKFRILFSLLLLMLISACSSTKKATEKKVTFTKADKIILDAVGYLGTRYKYGGTSEKGMDCSGLVYTAFKSQDIHLPRVSRDMAKKGKRVLLKNIQKGDLLFFKTNGSFRINHVGVVSYAKNGEIKFIHSTNSRGVIESSMKQGYWYRAFVRATTVLR